MAIVNGTAGNDFIHVAGDGEVPPGGYNGIATATGGDDTIFSGGGGDDIIFAGGGSDIINFGADLDGNDQITGGAGFDTLVLGVPLNVAFGANSLASIEEIRFSASNTVANLTMNNGNLAAGQGLIVDASVLDAGLTFDGSAETNGHFHLIGGVGNDHLTGGGQGDIFDFSQGGSDIATGGGGRDLIVGANESDISNGGTGFDTVVAASGADFFGSFANNFIDIEELVLNDNSVVANDAWIAAGKTMIVEGNAASFYGANELDGHFHLIQDQSYTAGWLGGDQSDVFDVTQALGTIINGNFGNDTIIVGGNLNDLFQIDGAEGTDTVELTGDYSAGYVFTNSTMTNVERLVLGEGFDYALTSDDANVAAGAALTIDAEALRASDVVDFDGSAESDGRFIFTGGLGKDTFTGGSGADRLTGGDGKDILTGGGGADRFIFTAIADSSVAAPDLIKDFSIAHDQIDVSAIDAIAGTASDDAFKFIGGSAFHHVKGELRAVAGGGNTIVQGDVTGDGLADFEITLKHALTLHAGDFIL